MGVILHLEHETRTKIQSKMMRIFVLKDRKWMGNRKVASRNFTSLSPTLYKRHYDDQTKKAGGNGVRV